MIPATSHQGNGTDPLATRLSRIGQFSAKQEINEWATVDARLDAALLRRVDAESLRASCKREVDEREDYLIVDGRNVEERKRAKVAALLDDDGYQALVRRLREAEREVAVLDVEIDSLGRQVKRLAVIVKYKTTCIAYLGGE